MIASKEDDAQNIHGLGPLLLLYLEHKGMKPQKGLSKEEA
jgi:hypothetical protein